MYFWSMLLVKQGVVGPLIKQWCNEFSMNSFMSLNMEVDNSSGQVPVTEKDLGAMKYYSILSTLLIS